MGCGGRQVTSTHEFHYLLASKIHSLTWPLILTHAVFSVLICAITCYCSTSQKLAEPKFPSFPNTAPPYRCPSTLMEVPCQHINKCLSLFCFFISVVCPIMSVHLGCCLDLVTSKTIWRPASFSSNFNFLISNMGPRASSPMSMWNEFRKRLLEHYKSYNVRMCKFLYPQLLEYRLLYNKCWIKCRGIRWHLELIPLLLEMTVIFTHGSLDYMQELVGHHVYI